MIMCAYIRILLGCSFLLSPLVQADAPPSESWEPDIRAFEAHDRHQPPEPGGIVFVGSSSIRLWTTMATDFPGLNVVNRGFGGSEIADSTHFADRIITAHRPRQVVLYAGDNDLMNGKRPRQVADDFRIFVERIRQSLPDARIAFISIKPSPARMHLIEAAREANARVREYAGRHPRIDYIDVFTPMLDDAGKPKTELFGDDELHLDADGYRLWRRIVAPYLRTD